MKKSREQAAAGNHQPQAGQAEVFTLDVANEESIKTHGVRPSSPFPGKLDVLVE